MSPPPLLAAPASTATPYHCHPSLFASRTRVVFSHCTGVLGEACVRRCPKTPPKKVYQKWPDQISLWQISFFPARNPERYGYRAITSSLTINNHRPKITAPGSEASQAVSHPLFHCPHALRAHCTSCQHLRSPFSLPPCLQNTFSCSATPSNPRSTALMPWTTHFMQFQYLTPPFSLPITNGNLELLSGGARFPLHNCL